MDIGTVGEIAIAVGVGTAVARAIILCAPAPGDKDRKGWWRDGQRARDNEDKKNKTERTLAKLAIEAWKMSRSVRRAQAALEPKHAKRLGNRLKWFEEKVKEGIATEGVSIIDPTGQAYDEGMAVTASNAEDFAADRELEIEDVLEPIIIGAGGRILHTGLVTLKERDT